MGSSCFARGNSKVLEMVEKFTEAHNEYDIDIKGHLCLGECSLGPNIRIDGIVYHALTPQEVIALLCERLDGVERKGPAREQEDQS